MEKGRIRQRIGLNLLNSITLHGAAQRIHKQKAKRCVIWETDERTLATKVSVRRAKIALLQSPATSALSLQKINKVSGPSPVRWELWTSFRVMHSWRAANPYLEPNV